MLKAMQQSLAAKKLAAGTGGTMRRSTREHNAVVVSSGLMQKTVKVRLGASKFNARIGKHFHRSTNLLVHDPASSLRTGDIISISGGWRTSKHVHHIVNRIIAPFGEEIDQRPPVPSEEELLEERRVRREAKAARKKELEKAQRAERSLKKKELEELEEKRKAKKSRRTTEEAEVSEGNTKDAAEA